MKRIIIFSEPNEKVLTSLRLLLFPKEIINKKFGYMPANGFDPSSRYLPFWENLARENAAEFIPIDNSATDSKTEIEKFKVLNLLLITGGRTDIMLQNLRKTGLDLAIKEFCQKDEFIFAGMSAGGMFLGPTLQLINEKEEGFFENEIGLTDFTGLNIVDFEPFPHYEPKQKAALKKYQQKTDNLVKPITNSELISIDF